MLALARLLRLPNVFSAISNVLVGMLYLYTQDTAIEIIAAVGILLCSMALYLSGMVWNDYFDLEEDRQFRPFRPLPSGQISVQSAQILATFLMIFAIVISILVDRIQHEAIGPTFALVLLLIGLIFAYDGLCKNSIFGPVVMGLCRSLNVLLGFSLLFFAPTHDPRMWIAGWMGLYIFSVTLLARNEERTSQKSNLLYAVTFIGLLLSCMPFLLYYLGFPNWWFVLPAWLLLLWIIGRPLIQVLDDGTPIKVQAAVKACLIHLILIDSILAAGMIGLWGYAIALLLLPAKILARKIYVT